MAHYHQERKHQGLENRRIRRTAASVAKDAVIHRRIRLGGMLSYYERAAA